MQLIFVLETKNDSGSDYIYLQAILKKYYKIIGIETKLSYVYMKGKGNYNKRKIEKDINTYKRHYDGESQVIYIIDLDNPNYNINQKTLNDKIFEYCKNNKYLIVIFKRTIEEVFIGKIVSDKEKIKYANNFFRKNQITTVPQNNLNININNLNNKQSNIMNVLNLFLPRL